MITGSQPTASGASSKRGRRPPTLRPPRSGVTAFGPLAGGWLAGRYRRGEPYPAGSRMPQRPESYRPLEREDTFAALERLDDLAGARAGSMAGLAAWLLADERVSAVVVGPGRPEHLASL